MAATPERRAVGATAGTGTLLEMSIESVRRMGVVAEGEPAGARMLVTDTFLDASGAVRIGMLGSLADCASGVHALELLVGATPVTADLVVHGTGVPVDVGTVVVSTSEVITQRRSGVVLDVSLFAEDGDGPRLGFSTVTYTPLPDEGARYATEALRQPWPPLDLVPSLDEVVRFGRGADGMVEVALTDDLRNGVGALAGGFSTLLVDVAAEQAAAEQLGAPVALIDQVVHFLAAGRVGPLGIVTEVVDTHAGSASVRVRVLDRGAGDRPILTATSTAIAVRDEGARARNVVSEVAAP